MPTEILLGASHDETIEHTFFFQTLICMWQYLFCRQNFFNLTLLSRKGLLPSTSECPGPRFGIANSISPAKRSILLPLIKCLCVGLCTWMPVEARSGWIPPGAEVTGGYVPRGCWDLNSGPLTAYLSSSLLHPFLFCFFFCFNILSLSFCV